MTARTVTLDLEPTPAEVAYWHRVLEAEARYPESCCRIVPDPADARAVAAYNQAVRQLHAEAEAEAHV